MAKPANKDDIQTTLFKLARPKMSPRELLREARRVHPDASKKEIIRAAFASIIAHADHDVEKAMVLQEFALKERGSDEVA